MKNLKFTKTFLLVAFITIFFTSCKDNKATTNNDANHQTEMKHSETAKVYACPMKCEGDKTYDKPGSCPKCGMDLKEMKIDDHSNHNH